MSDLETEGVDREKKKTNGRWQTGFQHVGHRQNKEWV